MLGKNRELADLIAESDDSMKLYEEVKGKKIPDNEGLQIELENLFLHIMACEKTGGSKTRLDALRKQWINLDSQIKQPMIEWKKKLKAAEDAVHKIRGPIVERVDKWARSTLQIAPVNNEFAQAIYDGIRKITEMKFRPADELLREISEFENTIGHWKFEKPAMLPALDFRDLISEV